MEKHTSYFFHVVRGSVSRYDVYIRTMHLLKILWERSLELSCPTYDTWYSVFTQNTWHLICTCAIDEQKKSLLILLSFKAL